MNCYFNELITVKYKTDASGNVYETKVPTIVNRYWKSLWVH